MKTRKPRHFPEKIQNNYGGDYQCPNFDIINNKEYCHDETGCGWGETISWAKTDNEDKLNCKGNRHNCYKIRQQWLASLPEKERFKELNKNLEV